MKIRIIKHLYDIDVRIRPAFDCVYDVKRIHEALYNPQKNKGYVVDVKGFEVMVFAHECIVLCVD